MSKFRKELVRVKQDFNNYNQQDSAELHRAIIDAIHEDLNRVKDIPIFTYDEAAYDALMRKERAVVDWNRQKAFSSSIVSDLFAGQIESVLKCSTCHHESARYDTVFDLCVPIPDMTGSSLVDCLNEYTKVEDFGDGWRCPQCKEARGSTKKILISKLPSILVLRMFS
jgi:ubiquitin carboxyl-terminal hydrolase 8